MKDTFAIIMQSFFPICIGVYSEFELMQNILKLQFAQDGIRFVFISSNRISQNAESFVLDNFLFICLI